MNDVEDYDDELHAIGLLHEAAAKGQAPEDAIQNAIARYPGSSGLIAAYGVQIAALGTTGNRSNVVARFDSQPTLSIVERAIAKMQAQREPAFESLEYRAQQRFGSIASLAEILSVGQSLLIKLDRRLITLASIPADFLDLLASNLVTSRAVLEAYLSLPPTLARSADYKARRRPVARGGQAFSDALKTCIAAGELTPDAALRWQSSRKD